MPEDKDCAMHEGRIDHIDGELHKQSGWFKTAGVVFSIAGAVVVYAATAINGKLDAISALLTDGKVIQMQHTEQIKGLDLRLRDVEDRHKYEDQKRR